MPPGTRPLSKQQAQSDTAATGFDPVESIRSRDRHFRRFLNAQPLPIKLGLLRQKKNKRQKRDEDAPVDNQNAVESPSEGDIADSPGLAGDLNPVAPSDPINCNWNIQTEPGLYLLVTFHNLSAPFTVECEGAYIEVERESNGFEARWCGNRVTQGGSRPHVIFAKNEVRISVFDDGSAGKDLPTGFSAEVEVIDLYDGEQYSNLSKTHAYSNVRKLNG